MKTALALIGLLALPAAASESAGTFVVVYQAAPANRVAFLRELESSGAKQLQRWKDEGALQGYRLLVSRQEYVAYLDDYVLPQVAGWAEEGVLDSHAVYLAQYPAARPWQSLLLLEYRGDEALAAREAVVAKVRARLAANAKWKAVSDNKKNVRVERPPVVADPVSSKEIR
ncbi:MAG: hypothetical protein E6J61_19230 [Deltaproteobacteria bacterium]|nr:MAG: hypothetical protein E6J61_19230 [Deltaproteobacteria bacterium]